MKTCHYVHYSLNFLGWFFFIILVPVLCNCLKYILLLSCLVVNIFLLSVSYVITQFHITLVLHRSLIDGFVIWRSVFVLHWSWYTESKSGFCFCSSHAYFFKWSYSTLMKLITMLLVFWYGKDYIASVPPFTVVYHSGLNAN